MGIHAEDAMDRAMDEMVAEDERKHFFERLQQGIHTTDDGREIPLKSMTENHLKNCIKFWKLYERSPFHEELENRGIFFNIIR